MKQTIQIGCNGLIIKANKLLLGLRKNNYGAGTYGLPGGNLEYGEKIIDATRREILEECGIKATKLVYNSTLDEIRHDQQYIHISFVVREFSGEVKCTEPEKCEGWEWFDLEKLPENIFPPHISIIKAYKENQPYNY